MAVNVILVLGTLAIAYGIGHLVAVRRARRDGRSEPPLFDFAAHRNFWGQGLEGWRRDPWYYAILIVGIAIVDGLTRTASFGVGFAVAVAFGFVASWAYRRLRRLQGR